MKTVVTSILLTAIMACEPVGSKENSDMEKKRITVMTKNESGQVVAKMQTLNGQLDGSCIWFDSKGEKIAEGTFKKGKPWSGTILNWSRFMPLELPFKTDDYSKDWITIFESSYDSEIPDYDRVMENYEDGKKIK